MSRLLIGLSIPAFFFSKVAAAEPPVAADAPSTEAANASATAPTRPAQVHDGFFFSGSAGAGARSMFVKGSEDVSVDGTGAAIGFRMGGAIARNLFLHATVGSSVTEDPEISIDSTTVTADGAKLSFVSVGPGLTYYFMPANVSLGGSALMMQTRLEFDGELLSKSEWGPGLELRIGKDFWVAQDFLLGVGLSGAAAVMSDQNTTDRIVAQAFNVMLDFSYD